MKPPTGEWAERGACKGKDPDVFFPDRGESTIPAKTMCVGCEVRAECLAYAMTTPQERRGVWGGLSGRERRKLGAFALGDYLPAVKLVDEPGVGQPKRKPPVNPGPINHGTTAGYKAHRRQGEDACQPCKDAVAKVGRQAKRRARERAELEAARSAIGPRRTTGRILEVVR